jgi:diaminopimelate epimerase
MKFSKWHALGNAYLLIERSDTGSPLAAETVRRLCDVHTGVGADGVLEIVAVEGPRTELLVWNPDGSRAELSGNGTRIAARWLAQRSGSGAVEIVIGDRVVRAWTRDGALVEQDLGPVEVSPPESLEIEGATVVFTPVSVGNTHAVIERLPDRDALLGLGPLVEQHPRFPGRTNVQLVRVDAEHELTVRVWERGAGETLASGTSACAAAAAMIASGRCVSPVVVHMPGGDVEVAIAAGRARLTGPAQEICRGEVADELLTGS